MMVLEHDFHRRFDFLLRAHQVVELHTSVGSLVLPGTEVPLQLLVVLSHQGDGRGEHHYPRVTENLSDSSCFDTYQTSTLLTTKSSKLSMLMFLMSFLMPLISQYLAFSNDKVWRNFVHRDSHHMSTAHSRTAMLKILPCVLEMFVNDVSGNSSFSASSWSTDDVIVTSMPPVTWKCRLRQLPLVASQLLNPIWSRIWSQR